MSGTRLRLCILTLRHSAVAMGGAEYQLDCLLDALIPLDRYDIDYVAAFTEPGFQPRGYRLTKIGRGDRAPRFGYLTHALPLLRALKQLRPDVIYQRVGCAYTGLAAYYAHRNGARLIWHVAHDSDVSREDLDTGRNPVRRILEKRSLEYGIRHAHQIVTQTEQQAQMLERNFGRAADAVIPNFHPEPRETLDKTGPLCVVWVANLKPWKQPEAFVRLAEQLRDLGGVSFVMVGAAPMGTGGRSWNHALMERIRNTPNLRYVGQKSQAEVNELLARSHVFVNTSLHEGFANTFIQAWLRGVPVVSLHVNPDRIFDRERVGICAGSEERLCEAVRLLLTDPARRTEYGARAQDYARRSHSVRNAALLAELIDTGRVASTVHASSNP